MYNISMNEIKVGDLVEYGGGIYRVFSMRGSLITLQGVRRAAASIMVGLGAIKAIKKVEQKIYAIRRGKETSKDKTKIFMLSKR